MNTELSLEVSNNLSLKLMRVYDTSHYCTDEPIENYLVEVLPVNKGTWTTFLVKKGFSLVLNSSSLRYNKVTTVEELVSLPDGIYEFKMSYKPNIKTVSHFYHLRVVSLQRSLNEEATKLISKKCDISKYDYHLNLSRIRDIEEYILAAKWTVEECNDKVKGKELYEEAEKMLKDYKNECKC